MTKERKVVIIGDGAVGSSIAFTLMGAPEDTIISLQHITKEFDGVTVVNDFNLDIKKGEFVTILGPSGCGKTTTLRMIAGFEIPTSGQILLNGEDISMLPPYKRPVNTVFQHYALFPHLDVYDNVAFGLKLKKVPVEETDRHVLDRPLRFLRQLHLRGQ